MRLSTIATRVVRPSCVDYTEFGGAATAALFAAEIDGIQARSYEPSPPTLELRASTAAANRR
jgi:hypothetical protein